MNEMNEAWHKMALDVATLNDMIDPIETLVETMSTASRSLDWLTSGIRNFGISFKVDKLIKEKAIMHNHGRARKVSLKRPSPQMSRARLQQIKATALLEATLKRGKG